MALASVTLAYAGTNYTFDEDDQTVLKGRLACDCEKSQLIREICDADFPVLKCGAQIVVISVDEAGEKKPASREKNSLRSRRASTAD